MKGTSAQIVKYLIQIWTPAIGLELSLRSP